MLGDSRYALAPPTRGRVIEAADEVGDNGQAM